jgi:ribosomal protein S18 acetylase RimI-like enzyme
VEYDFAAMAIRRLNNDELKELSAVYLRAYDEAWTEEGARAYLKKFFDFEPQSCLVAIEDGKAVGAILGFSYEMRGNEVLFIQELFVDPDWRHKGIGKALVSELRNSFTKTLKVSVKPLVRANTPVFNFYNSLGFETDQAFTFFDG